MARPKKTKKTTRAAKHRSKTAAARRKSVPAMRKAVSSVQHKMAPVVQKAVDSVHKRINVPNLLTTIRMWAIPVIVATFFLPGPAWAWIGAILFTLAGITDYLDGYLARHLNQLSRFGRVLDPIADKLLVGATLLMLAHAQRLGIYGIIPAVVIMSREILVSGLREFLAEIKVGCPVTRLAKWKTACQMTALPVLMISERSLSGCLSPLLIAVGSIALWGAAILTVMTGYDYWKSGRRHMND